ncbi:hypothetical protein KOR34_46280 [Posidoniimonas corsicana]|uniref:MurG-like transferase n=1 Tax=Posidoniimonas corsicana TaxID=1938618 RepID=A0A5C5V0H9_9BACT|nr:glycosyltransferase family protein [Posidoniimonas corsicana]TWT31252.1 hypothetical protein KOR34_46280 [Posidoniimonas corsicana]
MATIFYSVMGEGRGHAARARSMVERLRSRHRLVLYSSFDALEFLRGAYQHDPDVEVRETEGIKFHYSEGKLDLLKTISSGLTTWWNMRSTVNRLVKDFHRDTPDLVVCDFEPTLARAAHKCKVPVLSLDHQHFMIAYDLSSLPLELQRWAWAMGWSVWAFGIEQQRTVISAFYKPPLLPAWSDATQVGPLLRPAVAQREPEQGQHVLSYLRRATPPRVLEDLKAVPTEVRVYGLGERPPDGNLRFLPVSETSFLDNLAGCDCVIAAAGNQLLGEALHFGKPVLALPERKHHEQRINACFLKQLGGGDWRLLEEVNREDLLAFWAERDAYRQNLAQADANYDGTADAAQAIENMLAEYRVDEG